MIITFGVGVHSQNMDGEDCSSSSFSSTSRASLDQPDGCLQHSSRSPSSSGSGENLIVLCHGDSSSSSDSPSSYQNAEWNLFIYQIDKKKLIQFAFKKEKKKTTASVFHLSSFPI